MHRSDPYLILGLDRDADEATIRQRYLSLVREFPPDRQPERFAEIRAAYEDLNDPVARLAQRLFQRETSDSLDAILADVLSRLREKRIPTELLLSLGRSSC
jgi:curved DNA-binding protein CbpA